MAEQSGPQFKWQSPTGIANNAPALRVPAPTLPIKCKASRHEIPQRGRQLYSAVSSIYGFQRRTKTLAIKRKAMPPMKTSGSKRSSKSRRQTKTLKQSLSRPRLILYTSSANLLFTQPGFRAALQTGGPKLVLNFYDGVPPAELFNLPFTDIQHGIIQCVPSPFRSLAELRGQQSFRAVRLMEIGVHCGSPPADAVPDAIDSSGTNRAPSAIDRMYTTFARTCDSPTGNNDPNIDIRSLTFLHFCGSSGSVLG